MKLTFDDSVRPWIWRLASGVMGFYFAMMALCVVVIGYVTYGFPAVAAIAAIAGIVALQRGAKQRDEAMIEEGRKTVRSLIEESRRTGETYMIPVLEIVLAQDDPELLREAGRPARHRSGEPPLAAMPEGGGD